MMSGKPGLWKQVVENITALSRVCYVTIGMVFTEDNVDQCVDAVLFAHSLGAADVRVIPAAQYNKALTRLTSLPSRVLDQMPILKYRVNNIAKGLPVRGLSPDDQRKCWLALDDMAVAAGYHYPCIIYLREQGDPIGKLSRNVRQDRPEWIRRHQPCEDRICRQNCLDVCRDYNIKAADAQT
jgi:hypothetical protein